MKKTLAILLSLVICILPGCHAGEEIQLATEATIQTQPALETTVSTFPAETEGSNTVEETSQPTEATVAQETAQSKESEPVPEATVPQTTIPK